MPSSDPTLSRRELLSRVALAGAGATILSTALGQAGTPAPASSVDVDLDVQFDLDSAEAYAFAAGSDRQLLQGGGSPARGQRLSASGKGLDSSWACHRPSRSKECHRSPSICADSVRSGFCFYGLGRGVAGQ